LKNFRIVRGQGHCRGQGRGGAVAFQCECLGRQSQSVMQTGNGDGAGPVPVGILTLRTGPCDIFRYPIRGLEEPSPTRCHVVVAARPMWPHNKYTNAPGNPLPAPSIGHMVDHARTSRRIQILSVLAPTEGKLHSICRHELSGLKRAAVWSFLEQLSPTMSLLPLPSHPPSRINTSR
jgi:hypothetical protein